jgi:hypothetical protein
MTNIKHENMYIPNDTTSIQVAPTNHSDIGWKRIETEPKILGAKALNEQSSSIIAFVYAHTGQLT